MTLLHLHTALLESLDWDEESADEAVAAARDAYIELSAGGEEPTVYRLKKKLMQEYPEHVVEALVLFLESISVFSKEIIEDESEEN